MNDRGSASVLLIGVVAVAIALAMGAARLGGAVGAKARAETAADAAALAAAGRLARGGSPAEAQRDARHIATVNGARLEHCACRIPIVAVEVSLSWRGRRVGAQARAEVRGLVSLEDGVVADVREQRLGFALHRQVRSRP
jgi:secretion/DNA translocation related TadE-like protein